MPITARQFQDMAVLSRKLFSILETTSAHPVHRFNSFLTLIGPKGLLSDLIQWVTHAAELTEREGSTSLAQDYFDLRAALLVLSEDLGSQDTRVLMTSWFEGPHPQAARSAAEKLGLLTLSVSEKVTSAAGKPTKPADQKAEQGSVSGKAGTEKGTFTNPEARAYSLYQQAIQKKPEIKGAKDRELYDYIRENVVEDPKELDNFGTFSRHLRGARSKRGEQKNLSRHGRTGSTVAPDDL